MAKLKDPSNPMFNKGPIGLGGPVRGENPTPLSPFIKSADPNAGPSEEAQQGSLTPRDRDPNLPQRPEVGLRPLTPPSPEGQLGALMGGEGGGAQGTPGMPMSPSPVSAGRPNPMRLPGPNPSDLLGKAGGLLGGGIGLGGGQGGSAVPTDLLMMLTQLLGNR